MTIIDKVIAAVTPPETDEQRVAARQKALSLATPGGWLAMALEHHLQIEACFAAVKQASTAEARRLAQKKLAQMLSGHSLAEEATIYPAMAFNGEKGHSEMAYVEQSAAKVQLAGLEMLDPMSQDYMDKFEHLRGAVLHHVYEEESSRFPDLLEKADAATNAHITARYSEEFDRYMAIGSVRAAV
jgi:hypothetical protein